jgi:hypothetical protein
VGGGVGILSPNSAKGLPGGKFYKKETGGIIYGDDDNTYDPDNNTNTFNGSGTSLGGHAVATTNQLWKRNSTVGVNEALSYDGSSDTVTGKWGE